MQRRAAVGIGLLVVLIAGVVAWRSCGRGSSAHSASTGQSATGTTTGGKRTKDARVATPASLAGRVTRASDGAGIPNATVSIAPAEILAMIIQSERFGTSLSQALKVYAEALRTRRRLRAEATVGRAGIKMLFPVVLFILPALFVVTLVPGVLSVLRDLRGGIGPK